ncbi:MAG: glycoside hydrolase family 16 protein [Chitinophagaceae bacterium]
MSKALYNFCAFRKYHLLKILISGLAFFSCCLNAHGQKKKKWKLIWQDEFNRNGPPDESKWGFANRKKANWACYCYNDTSTAVVQKGKLLLKGIKAGENTGDTAMYQTGCLETKGKFSFLYGKVEVRAKLPGGKGSWPAIWLMPEEAVYGGWPHSGEIDVMEHLNHDTLFYQTMHSHYIDGLKHTNRPQYSNTASFKVGEYNVYGMEWSEDKIDFYINGKCTFTYPKLPDDTTGVQWPFNQKFYIILNQALGGSWAGPIGNNDLPQQMEVDYVRVYQARGNQFRSF